MVRLAGQGCWRWWPPTTGWGPRCSSSPTARCGWSWTRPVGRLNTSSRWLQAVWGAPPPAGAGEGGQPGGVPAPAGACEGGQVGGDPPYAGAAIDGQPCGAPPPAGAGEGLPGGDPPPAGESKKGSLVATHLLQGLVQVDRLHRHLGQLDEPVSRWAFSKCRGCATLTCATSGRCWGSGRRPRASPGAAACRWSTTTFCLAGVRRLAEAHQGPISSCGEVLERHRTLKCVVSTGALRCWGCLTKTHSCWGQWGSSGQRSPSLSMYKCQCTLYKCSGVQEALFCSLLMCVALHTLLWAGGSWNCAEQSGAV